MAKTLKRIYAGSIELASLSDRASSRDESRQRAAKKQASSDAQRRMNQIYSYQKFELMLAVNFPTAGSGLVITLTYDDEHLPKTRAEAQRRFKYFLQKLRAARKTAGLPEPVVGSAPEALSSASGRWHHHIVLDNTGRDYDMVRSCWIYGSEIEIKPLRVDKKKNHETLAKYMTKEARECQDYESKPGTHNWSWTRNAKRPEVDTVTVPDDYQLEPPEGSTVLLDERRGTELAAWQVLKIRWDGMPPLRVPRPKRRRRRAR